MSLNQIYQEAGLTAEDVCKMPGYLTGKEEFYGTNAFEKLFEYYAFSGEMPYGVAKCRTGVPDEWILDRLEEINEAR